MSKLSKIGLQSSCKIIKKCLGSGLKCQVCGDDGSGVCSSDDDNGESMECAEGLDVCYYYLASKNW